MLLKHPETYNGERTVFFHAVFSNAGYPMQLDVSDADELQALTDVNY